MEAQGLVPNSSTAVSDVVNDGIKSTSEPAVGFVTPTASASASASDSQLYSFTNVGSSDSDSEDPAAEVTDVE